MPVSLIKYRNAQIASSGFRARPIGKELDDEGAPEANAESGSF
jgi:hypothetical protein